MAKRHFNKSMMNLSANMGFRSSKMLSNVWAKANFGMEFTELRNGLKPHSDSEFPASVELPPDLSGGK